MQVPCPRWLRKHVMYLELINTFRFALFLPSLSVTCFPPHSLGLNILGMGVTTLHNENTKFIGLSIHIKLRIATLNDK